ncbi:hypothetical protein LSH36_1192g00007 [Paralvinella palmiformis]|uniref:Glycolipid transfer protein domain-containing protein n=1 Tax=Paralvinella palmiformis TaxID=53620 RepID=A0AAD9IU21_9ANNE|nr:hypothetical protein LSH36_1192g00007 [Paralvinella palmiformis]
MGVKNPDLNHVLDLPLLLDSASRCLSSADNIKTDDYLCIMHQLKKLLFSFHPGLSVVYKSGRSGLKSLEIHRVSGARCYYDSLGTMVQYEMDNDLLKGSSRLASGSVALRDLNHILGFILQFLLLLQQTELANEPFSAKERIGIYMKTLGIHHSLLVRLSCKMALSQCPGRHRLIQKFSTQCPDANRPTAVLNQLLEELYPVHDAVQLLLNVVIV